VRAINEWAPVRALCDLQTEAAKVSNLRCVLPQPRANLVNFQICEIRQVHRCAAEDEVPTF